MARLSEYDRQYYFDEDSPLAWYYDRSGKLVLPPDLQHAIVNSYLDFGRGNHNAAAIENCLKVMGKLPANSITRASSEIRDLIEFAAVYENSDRYVKSIGIYAFRVIIRALWKSDLRALKRYPEYARLFLFSHDGRLREAALKHLDKAPVDAFAFTAIVYRLNDWALQVRKAGYDYASVQFPKTSPDVIADAALFLLPQMKMLKRWGLREYKLLDDTLFRDDVMEAFAAHLIAQTYGASSKAMKQALRRTGLDGALVDLAFKATIPHIRVVALKALIYRRAEWATGFEYEWVDKPLGIRRRVTIMAHRPIEHKLNIETLLLRGAADRSALVRKMVAQALIDFRDEFSSAMHELGEQLKEDKSDGVRSRAAFANTPRD